MVWTDIMRGNQQAMNLQGEIKMAERMNITQRKSRKGDGYY